MKKLVILSGAGISAESGISTFRDAGGLWNKYPVMQVASIEGYEADPELVINFYNERRKQLLDVKPNQGHILCAELEKYFDVTVVTQNVDNLHERAGSHHIIHLHGELTKVCSSYSPNDSRYIKDIAKACLLEQTLGHGHGCLSFHMSVSENWNMLTPLRNTVGSTT